MKGREIKSTLSVFAVILLAAAALIAIAYLSSPIPINEMQTELAVRELAKAQVAFSRHNNGMFARDLETLCQSTPGFPSDLGNAPGYRLVIQGQGQGFTVTATPLRQGESGRRTFFIDETGVFRCEDDGANPSANSPVCDSGP